MYTGYRIKEYVYCKTVPDRDDAQDFLTYIFGICKTNYELALLHLETGDLKEGANLLSVVYRNTLPFKDFNPLWRKLHMNVSCVYTQVEINIDIGINYG